jgi:hypothetical protein
MELESSKTTLESASIELQEKDRVISALQEKLEESGLHDQKMLNLLETTDLASAVPRSGPSPIWIVACHPRI